MAGAITTHLRQLQTMAMVAILAIPMFHSRVRFSRHLFGLVVNVMIVQLMGFVSVCVNWLGWPLVDPALGENGCVALVKNIYIYGGKIGRSQMH